MQHSHTTTNNLIKFIRCKHKNDIFNTAYNYSLNSFWISNELDIDSVYTIHISDNIVGLLQITFGRYRNKRKYAHIDMIELFREYRNNGIGEKVIAEIFKEFKIKTIEAESLCSAIPF